MAGKGGQSREGRGSVEDRSPRRRMYVTPELAQGLVLLPEGPRPSQGRIATAFQRSDTSLLVPYHVEEPKTHTHTPPTEARGTPSCIDRASSSPATSMNRIGQLEIIARLTAQPPQHCTSPGLWSLRLFHVLPSPTPCRQLRGQVPSKLPLQPPTRIREKSVPLIHPLVKSPSPNLSSAHPPSSPHRLLFPSPFLS
jgi:hypothetical protein